MNRARHLLQSSVLVILFLGLGKLTGLVRIRLVARAFGTTPALDAFNAANQPPEVFFALIAGGALAAAFIPVYAQYLGGETTKKAARLANTILTLLIIILSSICAIGAILAPWLSRILVPGFEPEFQVLYAQVMRVILIQTTIFGISGVLSSVLNAHQHFALPALAPLSLDIGYVVGLTLFVPQMGVVGLAWGTVVGSVLHIGIQVPALVKYRFQYRPALDLTIPGVREIIRLMGPRILTIGTIQFADIFIFLLLSELPEGNSSGYSYGYQLQQLPETLFGTAIALVFFPTMAEMFNNGDIEGLKRTAVNAIRIIWTLTIPAAALLVLLGQPAISVFLESGEFDARSTQLVFSVLGVFSLRVVSEATLEIVARLFYAQHDTRTPMLAYLGWLVINVALAYLLVDKMGVVGLALASTVAFTILSGVLFELNRRRLGGLEERELAISAGRALLATAVISLVIIGIRAFVSNHILFLIISGTLGVGLYAALNLILGGREIPALINLIRRQPVQIHE